jgi:prophage DNA circulation protein
LVYDQFETITAEEDFIRRNKIAHPLFVGGGIDYEIVEVT